MKINDNVWAELDDGFVTIARKKFSGEFEELHIKLEVLEQILDEVKK